MTPDDEAPTEATSDPARKRVQLFTQRTLPQALRNTELWVGIDTSGLSDEERDRFARLTTAIQAWVDGKKMAPILKNLKLSYDCVQRAANRCVTQHSDGRLFGFRALIKGLRVKRYKRTKPDIRREPGQRGGAAGLLSKLFDDVEGIQDDLDEYLRTGKRKGGVAESRVTPKAALEYFHELCKAAGRLPHQFPFNYKKKGKGALYTYVKSFLQSHYGETVEMQNGQKAAAKTKTGTGHHSRLRSNTPYDIIEIDEHKAHFLGVIGIPGRTGIRWMALERVIIITVTDRATGSVLGYHAVFRREARSDDLLAAIHNALTRWEPRKFAMEGLRYREGAGFPSRHLDSLVGCGWAMLLFDNALIHLARPVIDRIMEMTGCDINFGPKERFERRGMAECVFGSLSRHGFERVSSTTGSGPDDPLRRDPKAAAIKTRLTMGKVLDVVELALADQNRIPGKRNDGLSPLAELEQWAGDPEEYTLVPQLPPRPIHLAPLNLAIERVRITGSEEHGVNPRIYFDHEFYTSKLLAKRWDLVGRWVWAHIDSNDVSRLKIYGDDRTFLDEVRVQDSRWRDPHSREERLLIRQWIDEKRIDPNPEDGYVRQFTRELARTASQKGPGARKAAMVLGERQRRESKGGATGAANDEWSPSAGHKGRVSQASSQAPTSTTPIGPDTYVPKGPPANRRLRAIN